MNRQNATKLLFLCPDNSIFSPIAAAWANELGEGDIHSFSAGFSSCKRNKTAIEVMSEAEIALKEQPNILTKELLKWPDLVIAYTDETVRNLPLPPGLQLFSHNIPSQLNKSDKESIRQVRDCIFRQIQPLIAGIKKSQLKQQKLNKKH